MSDTGLTPWMEQKLSQLLQFAANQGIDAKVISTLRTCSEQNAIYEGGAGVATTVAGCQSWHVWGRAADLQIAGPFSDYAILGDYWKRLGGVWGGDWKVPQDPGHFEWHPDVAMHDICPTGAECPAFSGEWPEDRPFFDRPAPRVILGLALAGGGVALARHLLRR
jgi:hypothetical protein